MGPRPFIIKTPDRKSQVAEPPDIGAKGVVARQALPLTVEVLNRIMFVHEGLPYGDVSGDAVSVPVAFLVVLAGEVLDRRMSDFSGTFKFLEHVRIHEQHLRHVAGRTPRVTRGRERRGDSDFREARAGAAPGRPWGRESTR